jgi:hypothetical protein
MRTGLYHKADTTTMRYPTDTCPRLIKACSLQILPLVTPGRQNIIFTPGGKVATLGHNNISPVINRRKTCVSFVASALNYSSFHYPSLLLFFFREKTVTRRPPLKIYSARLYKLSKF